MPYLCSSISTGSSAASAGAFGSLSSFSNTGCIYCDGVNQYATSAFDPSTIGTGDLTVELWFKPYHLETANGYYLFMLGDTTNGLAVQKIGSANNYRLTFWKGGSGSNTPLSSTPSELEWHQLVLTRTGTTITVKIDNVQVYSASSSSFDMSLNSGCNLGATTTPGGYWKGHLDVFRIWDSVLTSDEITAIYNSGTPIAVTSDSGNYESSANLQLDNLFDELTGTTVADNSGNSNTLTLQNSPTWNQDCVGFTTPDYAATHALELDGVSDYAIPFLDLKQSIDAGEFTIYARARFNDTTVNGYVFISGETAGSDNYISLINIGANNDTRATIRGSGGASQAIDSIANSVNDTWYDLVATRAVDGSNGTLEFFVNGVSQGTLTNTLLNDPIDRDTFIGRWLGGTNHLGGQVREIAIWDEVLTDDEITAITSLGDHDLRTDSGNYASSANLLNFLVAINLTGTMYDLQGNGSAVFQVSPSYVSYP